MANPRYTQPPKRGIPIPGLPGESESPVPRVPRPPAAPQQPEGRSRKWEGDPTPGKMTPVGGATPRPPFQPGPGPRKQPIPSRPRPTPKPTPLAPNGKQYNAITGSNQGNGSGTGFNPLSAGGKVYGSGRSAPNKGQTLDKGGYGKRDLKKEARRGAINRFMGG